MACATAAVLRNYGQNVLSPPGTEQQPFGRPQAALLLARLEWLDGFTQRRRRIANDYRVGIRNSAVLLMDEPIQIQSHVYHLFVVVCAQRDQLALHLKEHGVETLVHYPVPVHNQPPCKNIGRDPNGPVAERHAACLSIRHPQMSDADVAHVVEAINAFS
jgi:dTDP-4-amino-4,6-dideoxygalactose transaminase